MFEQFLDRRRKEPLSPLDPEQSHPCRQYPNRLNRKCPISTHSLECCHYCHLVELPAAHSHSQTCFLKVSLNSTCCF